MIKEAELPPYDGIYEDVHIGRSMEDSDDDQVYASISADYKAKKRCLSNNTF